MTSSSLYTLQWNQELQNGFADGSVKFMRDTISGLPLGVAQKGNKIAGMARLIPVKPSPEKLITKPLNPLLNIASPILSIANLFVSGYNAIQTRKMRSEIQAGFQQSHRMLEVMAYGLSEMNDNMTKGFNDVQNHITQSHAQLSNHIAQNHAQLSNHMAQHMAMTMVGIQLSCQIQEQMTSGFTAISEQLQDLKNGQEWIVESMTTMIDHQSAEIRDRKFREHVLQLHENQRDLNDEIEAQRLEPSNRAFADIRQNISKVVIPGLRALLPDLSIGTHEHTACLVVLSECYQTLGTVEGFLLHPQKSAKAYQMGFLLIQNQLKKLLLAETPTYQFYTNHLPVVELLSPISDALRIGWISASNTMELEVVPCCFQNDNSHDLSQRHLYLDYSKLPIASTLKNDATNTASGWFSIYDSSATQKEYFSRSFRQKITAGEEWRSDLSSRLTHVDAPSEYFSPTLDQDEVNALISTIDNWIDPANREAIISIHKENLGWEPPSHINFQLLFDASKYLSNRTNSDVSVTEVLSLSKTNLHLFAARERTKWSGTDELDLLYR